VNQLLCVFIKTDSGKKSDVAGCLYACLKKVAILLLHTYVNKFAVWSCCYDDWHGKKLGVKLD